jgi:hypothetical protein
MHETIPLQILDPFTELFEVGHTSPPTVQMPRSSYALCRPRQVIAVTTTQLICAPSLPRLITMAGIGARRSAFPVGKPHTAMRGAFALCDSPHTSMKVCPYTKTTLHEATRCRFSQTGLRP